MTHTPHFTFSAKEVLILIQAVRIASEDGSLYEYGRKGEIEAIRRKLGAGGDK
jgi:hypothetical protein